MWNRYICNELPVGHGPLVGHMAWCGHWGIVNKKSYLVSFVRQELREALFIEKLTAFDSALIDKH